MLAIALFSFFDTDFYFCSFFLYCYERLWLLRDMFCCFSMLFVLLLLDGRRVQLL